MVVLEDSYHMVTLDKQRHVVVERARAFLDSIVGELAAAAAAAAAPIAARRLTLHRHSNGASLVAAPLAMATRLSRRGLWRCARIWHYCDVSQHRIRSARVTG